MLDTLPVRNCHLPLLSSNAPEQIGSVVYRNGVVRFCGGAGQSYLAIRQNFTRDAWDGWCGIESECQRCSAGISGNVRFARNNCARPIQKAGVRKGPMSIAVRSDRSRNRDAVNGYGAGIIILKLIGVAAGQHHNLGRTEWNGFLHFATPLVVQRGTG